MIRSSWRCSNQAAPHCQWVTTWTRRYPGTRTRRAVDQLDELAGLMGDKAGGRDFSSSLLYHTRDTLSLLCGEREWMPGQVGELPAGPRPQGVHPRRGGRQLGQPEAVER